MLEKHYDGISERMMSELRTISEQMDHMGERGRNNEQILAKFLPNHLPFARTPSAFESMRAWFYVRAASYSLFSLTGVRRNQ
jgi:hypothetical protein